MTFDDFKKQVDILKDKSNLSINDALIKNYLLIEIKQSFNFITHKIKNTDDCELDLINDSQILADSLNGFLLSLGDPEKMSVTKTIDSAMLLVGKNPNKFKEDDFILISSMQSMFNKLMVIFSYAKNIENLPMQDEFNSFMIHLDIMDKLFYDLSCYSFWDEINGLVINNDRKKYLRQLNSFKSFMLNIKEDTFRTWLSQNFK